MTLTAQLLVHGQHLLEDHQHGLLHLLTRARVNPRHSGVRLGHVVISVKQTNIHFQKITNKFDSPSCDVKSCKQHCE